MGCGRTDDGQVGLSADHPIMRDLAERKAERAKLLAEDPTKELAVVEELVPVPTLIRFPPPPSADDAKPALPSYSADDEGKAPANPIAQVSAGTRHNLAVSRSGHAYSWGTGENSQLGLGPDVATQLTPIRIANKALDSGFKVEFASSGGQHCILLASKPA
ncbi:hypothetical protein EXIGLDRAFT_85664 [Exidia glandulosa HHB12029]|uniref:RCC1/BLIP-II protein n=1 Tax=Exidia glandulosa HHB12029 TaxID=1314781 RepID=A0A166MFS4_EXIGL|nr:hypothetical protein EXIGLDRAFT_85664 [Exidia glandulosa HHB12029]